MQENNASLSPELLFEIKVHGFLLWASLGFLMPVGILAMRMLHIEKLERRLRLILRVHVTSQIASAVLATAAAAMSIKNFENSFSNCHRRIGVVVYGLVWLQVLIGFLRPQRGCKERRRLWFCLHWVLGTALALLGAINIYTGLLAYRNKTSRSVKLWLILFTAEISSVAIVYLFQDKWTYLQVHQQGVVSRHNEPVMPIIVDRTEMGSPDSKTKEMPV